MVAKIYIGTKFHFHPKYAEIYAKVMGALKDFPEIKELELSAFYPSTKVRENGTLTYSKNTVAVTRGDTIAFNMNMVPGNMTLYHELQHVVQDQNKLNKNKKAGQIEADATIYGVARMSKARVDHPYIPYIGTVPKSRVTEYMKFAVNEAKKGNTKYLDAVKAKIKVDRKKSVKQNKENAKLWKFPKGIHADAPVSKSSFIKKKGKTYAKGLTDVDVKEYLSKHIPELTSTYKGKNLFDTGSVHKTVAYPVDIVKNPPKWMAQSTSNKPKRSKHKTDDYKKYADKEYGLTKSSLNKGGVKAEVQPKKKSTAGVLSKKKPVSKK